MTVIFESDASTPAMSTFGFDDQLVRVFNRDGVAWFVSNDVCAALGIEKPRNAAARLEDDEKKIHNVDTKGGPQTMTLISESGLYALIFTSRKPDAKRFRRWVTQEVLPTLRRMGEYQMSGRIKDGIGAEEPAVLDFAASDEAATSRHKLAIVREARILFGPKAARRAWTMVGLLPGLIGANEPVLDKASAERRKHIALAELACRARANLAV